MLDSPATIQQIPRLVCKTLAFLVDCASPIERPSPVVCRFRVLSHRLTYFCSVQVQGPLSINGAVGESDGTFHGLVVHNPKIGPKIMFALSSTTNLGQRLQVLDPWKVKIQEELCYKDHHREGWNPSTE